MQTIRFQTTYDYPVKVSGESHHRDEIEAIFGAAFEDGVNEEGLPARLILEDNNKYDPNAVRVEVEGRHVGYLSRSDAQTYRDGLLQLNLVEVIGQCTAKIRGGYLKKNTDEWAEYGVTLDIDLENLAIYIPSPPRSRPEPSSPIISTPKAVSKPQKPVRKKLTLKTIIWLVLITICLCTILVGIIQQTPPGP